MFTLYIATHKTHWINLDHFVILEHNIVNLGHFVNTTLGNASPQSAAVTKWLSMMVAEGFKRTVLIEKQKACMCTDLSVQL